VGVVDGCNVGNAVVVGFALVGDCVVGAAEVGAAVVGACEDGEVDVGACELGDDDDGDADVGETDVGACVVGDADVGDALGCACTLMVTMRPCAQCVLTPQINVTEPPDWASAPPAYVCGLKVKTPPLLRSGPLGPHVGEATTVCALWSKRNTTLSKAPMDTGAYAGVKLPQLFSPSSMVPRGVYAVNGGVGAAVVGASDVGALDVGAALVGAFVGLAEGAHVSAGAILTSVELPSEGTHTVCLAAAMLLRPCGTEKTWTTLPVAASICRIGAGSTEESSSATKIEFESESYAKAASKMKGESA